MVKSDLGLTLLAAGALLACSGKLGQNSQHSTTGAGSDVLQHHRNPNRDGLYVDPLLTQAAAIGIRRDLTFSATLPGPTYAQPLYMVNGPGGQEALFVVRCHARSCPAATSTRWASPVRRSSIRRRARCTWQR